MATGTTGIEKAPTGIRGFDEMTGGGIPRGRTTLLLGGAGTGKTNFALQTLVHGAQELGEPGIFVAFEESAAHIRANAAAMGWDLPALEDDRLFFLDARIPLDTVQSGSFDLSGILTGLAQRAQAMGARRIVFDAIDVLLALLDDAAMERGEIYRLHNWIEANDFTGVVTAKVDGEGTGKEGRYGFLHYMADCVISLEQTTYQLMTSRHLQIEKYRGSGYVENRTPMLISEHGIRVAGSNPIRLTHPVQHERVSSGVEALDQMLTGGYYRGTNVLLTGAPGTAKSTLAGAFVEAACRRGERAMFVSFDEGADEIVRNLQSVNIDLQSHRDAGLLAMHSVYSGYQSAEAHLMALQNRIEAHRPTCVVIDPLSAIMKSGEVYNTTDVAQRLLYGTKAQGITTLCTSLMGSQDSEMPATALSVSTIADTWIHLTYESRGGEQNRSLIILKSRGTGHSGQVRELVLSDEGVKLREVYTAGGEVLMGTLRWEREEEQRREEERAAREVAEKQRALAFAETEVRARIALLEQELEMRREEVAQLAATQAQRREKRDTRTSKVREMRLAATGKDVAQEDNGKGAEDD